MGKRRGIVLGNFGLRHICRLPCATYQPVNGRAGTGFSTATIMGFRGKGIKGSQLYLRKPRTHTPTRDPSTWVLKNAKCSRLPLHPLRLLASLNPEPYSARLAEEL